MAFFLRFRQELVDLDFLASMKQAQFFMTIYLIISPFPFTITLSLFVEVQR